ANQIHVLFEEFTASRVHLSRGQDIRKIRRQKIDQVDQQERLRRRGVLKERMVREQVPQTKDSPVRGCLVAAAHGIIKASLIGLIIDNERRYSLQAESCKDTTEIVKMPAILHH